MDRFQALTLMLMNGRTQTEIWYAVREMDKWFLEDYEKNILKRGLTSRAVDAANAPEEEVESE